MYLNNLVGTVLAEVGGNSCIHRIILLQNHLMGSLPPSLCNLNGSIIFLDVYGNSGMGGTPPLPLTWGTIAPLGIVGVDRGTFGVCIPFTMLNRESNGHDEYQTVWVKHDHLTRQK